MFDYKPQPAAFSTELDKDIGWAHAGFEAFEPNPKYSWQQRRRPETDSWPIVVPKGGPRIGNLPKIVEDLIKATWKYTEPQDGAARGNIMMGTRGMAAPAHIVNGTYHTQVRPTTPVLRTQFPTNTPIATDWYLFNFIQRTHAVTFRGDTRPPSEVIGRQNGFNPPNSRTDRYYLEKNIYEAFNSYSLRRFKNAVDKTDFLRAVDSVARSEDDQKLLVDYMMWRKIAEREAVHLGRMVENECLKGYISTARSIDTSIRFGTAYHTKPGWLYMTVVHGGFVVPFGERTYWGTEEGEIAQWGPIPGERIVGFVHLDGWAPDSAIYIRRKFRKDEPKAFEKMFNVLSGKTTDE
jgi:hypothetical protein